MAHRAITIEELASARNLAAMLNDIMLARTDLERDENRRTYEATLNKLISLARPDLVQSAFAFDHVALKAHAAAIGGASGERGE